MYVLNHEMESIFSRRGKDTRGVREILLQTVDTEIGVQNHPDNDILQNLYSVPTRLLPNLTFPTVPGDAVELCLCGEK